MILKGLTFTPTSACSRLKIAIHENFTVFHVFPRSIYGLFAAPLQLNMVAKGCNAVFLVMLFPDIWARNIVGQSRLSKTHRNPITQSWKKKIYIFIYLFIDLFIYNEPLNFECWASTSDLQVRGENCQYCGTVIVTTTPINSNCFAGLSRGAALFLSKNTWIYCETSSNHGIISWLLLACVWQLYLKHTDLW
jgi:hypothetical protein